MIGTIALVLALVMIQGAAMGIQPGDSPPTDVVPEVSGRWRMERPRLAASTCPATLTDTVRERIRRGALDCDFVVLQEGAHARVNQICPEETLVFVAEIDARGHLHASDHTQIDDYGCRWFFTNTLSAALERTPAAITVTYRFQFEPSCRFPDCVMELVGELER